MRTHADIGASIDRTKALRSILSNSLPPFRVSTLLSLQVEHRQRVSGRRKPKLDPLSKARWRYEYRYL